MNVSLKEEYKGVVYLRMEPTESAFRYYFKYRQYPDFIENYFELKEGDLVTIRNPDTGGIVLQRVLDFDYEYGKMMNESGTILQIVDAVPIRGIQKGLEPSYWLSMFTRETPADVVRTI